MARDHTPAEILEAIEARPGVEARTAAVAAGRIAEPQPARLDGDPAVTQVHRSRSVRDQRSVASCLAVAGVA